MPENPDLLYSVINTMLRDKYKSLQDLCEDLSWQEEEINEILGPAGYHYNPVGNRFAKQS
ncbi:MAG: DUF4250 domain-containing protein [Lachnospiraceae bacterium]|nr:DUF4250 domain-containing protein [Lachnospiraceae bacterium]